MLLDYACRLKGRQMQEARLSNEEKFIFFEKEERESYIQGSRNDHEHQTDQNGNYFGSYEYEKTYVVKMCAFLDEYELDNSIADISGLKDDEFNRKFDDFKNKMTYMSTRFHLRKDRVGEGPVGTTILIPSTYKAKIGDLLQTIRKIVNQEVSNENKREKIFSKIASLQSEVDRDRTTVDALFSRAIDLSRTIGEFGENIEPLIDKMERLKNIFWDNSNNVSRLQNSKRPKLIEEAKSSFELSDEIPF